MNKTEVILGQVIAKANSYMAVPATGGEKRIIKNAAIRAYEQSFVRQCKIYKDRLISCHFKLFIVVYQRSVRFDLDNSLKTVLDCLQQVRAITDDNLCYSIHAEKRIDKNSPRIEFMIEEYEPTMFNK